jgi:hypothetical protein
MNDFEMKTGRVTQTPSGAKTQEIKDLIAQVSQPLPFEKEMSTIIQNYNARNMSQEDQKNYFRWQEKTATLQLLEFTLEDYQKVSAEVIELEQLYAGLQNDIDSASDDESLEDVIERLNYLAGEAMTWIEYKKRRLLEIVRSFESQKEEAEKAGFILHRIPRFANRGGTKRTRTKRTRTKRTRTKRTRTKRTRTKRIRRKTNKKRNPRRR